MEEGSAWHLCRDFVSFGMQDIRGDFGKYEVIGMIYEGH